MTVTPEITFVGFQSGANTRYDPNAWDANLGSRNVFLGYQAGEGNRYGHHNVFLGYQAGRYIVGDSLDDLSNSFNILIGPKSGLELEYSYSNILIGSSAGEGMFNGENNIFLGEGAGRQASGAYNNILIGTSAGNSVTTYNNVMIGNNAGYSNSTGNSNVFIGSYAGNSNNGNRNVFIGHYAGYGENGSGKLYIENAVTNIPLIYGDFSNDLLRLNAEVAINAAAGDGHRLLVSESRINYGLAAIHGINIASSGTGVGVEGTGGYMGVRGNAAQNGTGYRYGVYGTAGNAQYNYGVMGYAYGGTSYAVYAAGTLAYSGSIIQASDAKFKEDIQPLTSVLGHVMKLKPRKYSMSVSEEAKSAGISPGIQFGLVAQEIETIFPELVVEVMKPELHVSKDGSGNQSKEGAPETYKGVKYMELIPILIKGMQEQQEEIEALKQRISELEGN